MKDPALLWYFNDWAGGTQLLNRHQKGCYMDLLQAQFNNGPLTIEDIKLILGADFGQWPKLENKFCLENGRYYNKRLKYETERRSKYTESRRNNAKHMHEHMENGNRNENRDTELPDWMNKKAWAAWENHRREKKHKLTPTSIKLQLKFLAEHQQDHAQIIKNSITNGWTGLFPLKDGQRKPTKYVPPNLDKETNDLRNALVDKFKASNP